MKRTVVALAVLIGLAPLAARAQSSIISQIAGDKAATEDLYFSLKFGLNVSHLRGPAEAARTGGFNIGISAAIQLTPRLSLVPEITPFSRKGAEKIPFTPTGDPELDARFADPTRSALALSYVDIPVLVKYRLPIGSAALFDRLRLEKSVLITPGAHFGIGRYIRIGYGYDIAKTLEGLRRLDAFLAGLREGRSRSEKRSVAAS